MTTTTDGGGDDRLSDLSDDLLRRILYFVPSKEAAFTSVLSRRWGSLWRSSGAVNLAVQVHDYETSRAYGRQRHGRSFSSYEEAQEAFFSDQDAFVRAAKAALDAAEAPITRLTLRVESSDGDSAVSRFLCRGRDWCTDTDVVGDLLSHQAARRVEELRVTAAGFGGYRCSLDGGGGRGIYQLVSLPSSETLCVLDLTRCDLKLSSSSSSLQLPRLATLRLCLGSVEHLQALLDASPELTTVHLKRVLFLVPPPPQDLQQSAPSYEDDDDDDDDDDYDSELDTAEDQPPVLRLNFHAVTTLVLASCEMQVHDGSGYHRSVGSNWAMEIEAPRLQSFTYKGLMQRFILRPPAAAPGVAMVDLHFLQDDGDGGIHRDKSESFWQFLHNFVDARTLRLKVDNDLKDIATIGKERRARLLCAFPNMERLELEGTHRPKSKTAAIAIANLLHCCPVLGELMLKLSTGPSFNRRIPPEMFLRKDKLDYNKSIDRFIHRRKSKTTAISMAYDGVPGIPGLSGRSFACLERTLRRVGLQFRLDNNSISSCLGVRLIKFFAGHASVLEEICVDTGNRRLFEHLNFNVVTQISLARIPVSATASIQHENQEESSSDFSRIPDASVDSIADLARSTVGFTVLPLRRKRKMDCKL